MALVDGDSRVRKTGVVFLDTLFDENAACHIAWGQGIPVALDGGEEMTAERARRARLQRLDRPHGLHDRRPRGLRLGVEPGGAEVPIIEDDRWALA